MLTHMESIGERLSRRPFDEDRSLVSCGVDAAARGDRAGRRSLLSGPPRQSATDAATRCKPNQAVLAADFCQQHAASARARNKSPDASEQASRRRITALTKQATRAGRDTGATLVPSVRRVSVAVRARASALSRESVHDRAPLRDNVGVSILLRAAPSGSPDRTPDRQVPNHPDCERSVARQG